MFSRPVLLWLAVPQVRGMNLFAGWKPKAAH